MESARIGIIVPAYNAERHLSACIKSILSQTYRQFLLIIIDDGSTDDTVIISDNFAKKDDRIRVIHQKNQGSTVARNVGIQYAYKRLDPNSYVCFCDADDCLPDDALQIMLNATLIAENVDMVCGMWKKKIGWVTIKESSIPPCLRITQPRTYDHEQIINNLYISYFGITDFSGCLWGKLIKISLIYDISLKNNGIKFFADDLSINIKLLPKISKLVIIPNIIYHYRINGGTSKFMIHFFDDCLTLYHLKLNMMQEYSMPQDAEYFTKVELKNMLSTWLHMCSNQGGYSNDDLLKEIIRSCNIPEVVESVTYLQKQRPGSAGFTQWVINKQYEQILINITHEKKFKKIKRIYRRLLKFFNNSSPVPRPQVNKDNRTT